MSFIFSGHDNITTKHLSSRELLDEHTMYLQKHINIDRLPFTHTELVRFKILYDKYVYQVQNYNQIQVQLSSIKCKSV